MDETRAKVNFFWRNFPKKLSGYETPKMICKGVSIAMAKSSNNLVNPNAREAMDRFKMEAASHLGVPERY